MSSIQGTSGSSPERLPNSREDEGMNPEGVTPSGQTISFSAVGKSTSAEDIQQLALPIIQSDAMASSPSVGGAVGEVEVAEIIADVMEKNDANVQKLDEDMEALLQAISSSEEQLESPGVRNKSALKGTNRSNSHREEIARNQRLRSLSVRHGLAHNRHSLRRLARGIRHHAGLVTASFATLHKTLRAVPQEDLKSILGKDSDTVLARIHKLGLEVNEKGEWRLRANGEVGSINQSICNLARSAERLHDDGPLSINDQASEEEVTACCSAGRRACQFLQEHLMGALQAIYYQILRFFHWISRRVEVEPEDTDYYMRPGIFINPYASYLSSSPSVEDPRSLRDRLRDGGALSGEDTLFSMPQDESLDSESVSDDDRGFQ